MPAQSHTFVELDHEVILLPSATSKRVVVSCKRKEVHEVSQACRLGWRDCPNMTIAVDWAVKHQPKTIKIFSHHALVIDACKILEKGEPSLDFGWL